MIEKVGHVSNPLTVIAIFAAISEISLVGGMTVVTPELQHIYIWFVMALPTILVLAFFGVLVRDRRVLYAPSDFRDDSAFVALIQGQGREIASRVDQTIEQLEATTKEIKAQIDALQGVSEEQRQNLEKAVASALEPVNQQLRGTAQDAELLLEKADAYIAINQDTYEATADSYSTMTTFVVDALKINDVDRFMKDADRKGLFHRKAGKVHFNIQEIIDFSKSFKDAS